MDGSSKNSPRWVFAEKAPNEKEREPTQGAFFAGESIKNLAYALVREGIQNSLDARKNNERVEVRITLLPSESFFAEPVDPSKAAPFFEGIWPHLQAKDNGLPPSHIPKPGSTFPVLVFEDFGTTGLTGNPFARNVSEKERNNFYNFFWAEGRSAKHDKNLGRWGIGKAVFLLAGRIRTLFGYTVRDEEPYALLQGMCTLRHHTVNGRRYKPDGWFGYVNQEEQIEPITDADTIARFCETFRVTRTNETGLSLVIPFYDTQEITFNDLFDAVVTEYVWPILTERLVVTITDASGTSVELNSENLLTEVAARKGDEQKGPDLEVIRLAARASREQNNPDVVLPLSALEADAEAEYRDTFNRLNAVFESYEPIHVRLTTHLPQLGESFVDVYIMKNTKPEKNSPIYIRGDITIPDPAKGRGVLGAYVLFVAGDTKMSKFLGDSENPAHTDWQANNEHFRKYGKEGKEVLKNLKNAPRDLVLRILNRPVERDETLFLDYFFIPEEKEHTSPVRESEESYLPGTEPEVPTPPTEDALSFVIREISQPPKFGFAVTLGSQPRNGLPRFVEICAAYGVRNKNPFRFYSVYDFDFKNEKQITVKCKGAEIKSKNENRLVVKIVDPTKFSVWVLGFDRNRDIKVNVRPIQNDNADSQLY